MKDSLKCIYISLVLVLVKESIVVIAFTTSSKHHSQKFRQEKLSLSNGKIPSIKSRTQNGNNTASIVTVYYGLILLQERQDENPFLQIISLEDKESKNKTIKTILQHQSSYKAHMGKKDTMSRLSFYKNLFTQITSIPEEGKNDVKTRMKTWLKENYGGRRVEKLLYKNFEKLPSLERKKNVYLHLLHWFREEYCEDDEEFDSLLSKRSSFFLLGSYSELVEGENAESHYVYALPRSFEYSIVFYWFLKSTGHNARLMMKSSEKSECYSCDSFCIEVDLDERVVIHMNPNKAALDTPSNKFNDGDDDDEACTMKIS